MAEQIPKILSREKELEMIKEIKAGNSLKRTEFFEINIPLVKAIAGKYIGGSLEFDELVSEGMLGFNTALELYEPECCNRFSDYAVWWIKQRILKALNTSGLLIATSPIQFRRHIAIRKATDEFEQGYGRQPTTQELSDVLGISPQEIYNVTNGTHETVPMTEGMLNSLMEGSIDMNCPYRIYYDEQIMPMIMQAIEDFPDKRMKVIINMSFGLDGEQKSLTEMTKEFKLSKERIRQLKETALQIIRDKTYNKYQELLEKRDCRY